MYCQDLSKRYGGFPALDGINLTIHRGRIIGLLGPNGSGKTTFLKLIAGLLTPSRGQILINGVPVGVETKSHVSYLPERTYFEDGMSVIGAVNGTMWDTERPISSKEYKKYLLEAEPGLQPVHKVKYRFNRGRQRFELDVYPFSKEKAVMFAYAGNDTDEISLPPEIEILREVTGDPEYKNKTLARRQTL